MLKLTSYLKKGYSNTIMDLGYFILFILSILALIGYVFYTQESKYHKDKLPFDNKFSKYKKST